MTFTRDLILGSLSIQSVGEFLPRFAPLESNVRADRAARFDSTFAAPFILRDTLSPLRFKPVVRRRAIVIALAGQQESVAAIDAV